MRYIAQFDGSSKGNPGPARGAWAVLDDSIKGTELEKVVWWKIRDSKEKRTNNVAEYVGLIELLNFILHSEEIGEISIVGDSKLVINQVNGLWKCKASGLKLYFERACGLMEEINNHDKKVTIKWVRREENKIADRLAQEGRL